MRIKREHGRILSVETQTRGSALAADVAAGATMITVDDAGDFDEDGGWLYIGSQVVEFTEVDDDAGVITLATALTAAGGDGDPVHVWSPLYEETVDYQVAQVQLDGDFDNLDPVEAEVAEGVDDLPEGDRGGPGESCTLHRIAADEWEVVHVGGRSRKSRSLRFEADDTYTLTAADITAGTATFPLTHRPLNEAIDARWLTVPQQPSNFTVNYDAQTITWPLSGFEKAGQKLWVLYAYRKGISTPPVVPSIYYLTLGDTVGVSNGGLLSGDQASIVGAGPVWKDGSDATYADIVTQMHGSGQPQFMSSASCAITAGDLSALPSTTPLIARLRVAAVSADMPYPTILVKQTSAVIVSGSIAGTCPMAPTWVEIPVTAGSLAAFFTNPTSFSFEVHAPTKAGASGDQHWRIYEAQLYVQGD